MDEKESKTELLRGSLTREELLGRYVDVPKYLGYCAECPHFGEFWSCPPYDFDPMDVWNGYDRLDILAMRIYPEGEGEKALAAADPETFLLPYGAELTRMLVEWERQEPGSLRLNPGRCKLCTRCARIEGKPCRHREDMRWSIESLGGAVGDIARDVLRSPLYWGQAGQAPAYFLLVGGLLRREETC